jgi:modulator of FtsH protease
MMLKLAHPGILLTLGGYFALLFLTSKYKDSAKGLAFVFALAGFMGGFLMVGIVVGFLAGIGAIFFEMPGLSLAISAMFVLLMSCLILYQTSEIINGGETNYIMETVTLYLTIFNIFNSLIHILGAMGNDD